MDSNKGNLLEYSTQVHFLNICTLLEFYFLGKLTAFTPLHLKGKYCTFDSTTFLLWSQKYKIFHSSSTLFVVW